MNNISSLILTAFLIESAWEALKPAWPKAVTNWEETKGIPVDNIGIIILAISTCITANLDVFQMAGIHLSTSFLGQILTGILVSRGSNFIHEIISSLQTFRSNHQA